MIVICMLDYIWIKCNKLINYIIKHMAVINIRWSDTTEYCCNVESIAAIISKLYFMPIESSKHNIALQAHKTLQAAACKHKCVTTKLGLPVL